MCVFVVVPRCACVYSGWGGGGGVRVCVSQFVYVFEM